MTKQEILGLLNAHNLSETAYENEGLDEYDCPEEVAGLLPGFKLKNVGNEQLERSYCLKVYSFILNNEEVFIGFTYLYDSWSGAYDFSPFEFVQQKEVVKTVWSVVK